MQRAGTIEKTYHAAVLGVPPEASGEIDAPIARVPGSSLLRCVDPRASLRGLPIACSRRGRCAERSAPCWSCTR